MSDLPTVASLIARVDGRSPGTGALDRLTTAAAVARELEAHGDALVDHYVDQARRAGVTWAQIGAALQVSKQAAQQRSAGRSLPVAGAEDSAYLRQFTARAYTALTASRRRAESLGHSYVGTEHLLLGLLDDPESLACTVLEALGPGQAALTAAIRATFPPASGDRSVDPVLTPRARSVLSAAIGEALGLGHNYIGTEHLLLAMYREPEGSAAMVLAGAGLARDAIRAEVVRRLAS